uniref:Uncharacterized protein n=1 Tax=Oryza nivara TaxID=4536 RepID=A0A0E0IL40_ORYNI
MRGGSKARAHAAPPLQAGARGPLEAQSPSALQPLLLPISLPKHAYQAQFASQIQSAGARQIWEPSKCKLFSWLLLLNRI